MMQKFHKGDHVRVANDLGPSMSHFQSDCEAIVIGSYKGQFGGSGGRAERAYTIHIKGGGQTSWYEESQLTLIEAGRLDLLTKWEQEAEAEANLKGDMDWIFANGNKVMAGAHGASLETLGKCLGISNLWGSHDEGATYYMNAMAILGLAEPFLRSGDRSGFERAADRLREGGS